MLVGDGVEGCITTESEKHVPSDVTRGWCWSLRMLVILIFHFLVFSELFAMTIFYHCHRQGMRVENKALL